MIAHAVERTPATLQTGVRSPVSPGVDSVFHFDSGATSFGRDVKPKSRLRAATGGKRTENPLCLPKWTAKNKFEARLFKCGYLALLCLLF